MLPATYLAESSLPFPSLVHGGNTLGLGLRHRSILLGAQNISRVPFRPSFRRFYAGSHDVYSELNELPHHLHELDVGPAGGFKVLFSPGTVSRPWF